MESVPHLSSHDGPGRVQAEGLLAADVVAYADGAGYTQTFTRPVYGRERIARLVPGFETGCSCQAPRSCASSTRWPVAPGRLLAELGLVSSSPDGQNPLRHVAGGGTGLSHGTVLPCLELRTPEPRRMP